MPDALRTATDARLATALQEDVLCLICHNDEHGRIVAGLVEPLLFEGDYREIATKSLDFWREYQEAPKSHLPNLLSHILEEGDARKAGNYRRILLGMAQLSTQINAEFILSQLHIFLRWQTLKRDTIETAGLLQRQPSPEYIQEIESRMYATLRARQEQFDGGMRLDEDLDPFLTYLQQHYKEFTTGLGPLDRLSIVPTRGEVMLFVAGKGRGKSWWLVNIGKRALLAGKKVLHLTLELSDMETRLRYYQALFAVPRHSAERVVLNRMKFDKNHEVVGFEEESVEPKFDMASNELRSELETHIGLMGLKTGNLRIKRFPNRTMTVEMMEAYIDRLEQIDGFVPDIVLLDYAKLMKLSSGKASDRRIALGDNLERLRGNAIERNYALCTADQLNRMGYDRKQARSSHIGEDWSQIHTADITLTHSATEAEQRKGLARLYVDHARSQKDKFGMLLTQSFDIGQFVLESVNLPKDYFEKLEPKDASAVDDAPEEDDPDGYDQD